MYIGESFLLFHKEVADPVISAANVPEAKITLMNNKKPFKVYDSSNPGELVVDNDIDDGQLTLQATITADDSATLKTGELLIEYWIQRDDLTEFPEGFVKIKQVVEYVKASYTE